MKISKAHALVVHAVAFGSTAAFAGMFAFEHAPGGGTLKLERHPVEELRGPGMDSPLEALANDLPDGSTYSWLADGDGNLLARVCQLEDGSVASYDLALPEHDVTWSFSRNSRGWSLTTWESTSSREELVEAFGPVEGAGPSKSHAASLLGYVRLTDRNADGMPEKKTERPKVGEPPVKLKLAPEVWIPER